MRRKGRDIVLDVRCQMLKALSEKEGLAARVVGYDIQGRTKGLVSTFRKVTPAFILSSLIGRAVVQGRRRPVVRSVDVPQLLFDQPILLHTTKNKIMDARSSPTHCPTRVTVLQFAPVAVTETASRYCTLHCSWCEA